MLEANISKTKNDKDKQISDKKFRYLEGIIQLRGGGGSLHTINIHAQRDVQALFYLHLCYLNKVSYKK